MRIAFFDIETRKGPRTLSPHDEEAGWEKLRRGEGGIAALCIYDTKLKWLYIYDDSRKSLETAVRHLELAEVVVGYSSNRFDVPCLEGMVNRKVRIANHIDLFEEVSRACALRGIKTSIGDLKLDTLCRKNLGRGKIEHGSHNEDLIANCQWGDLFNYCADDVHLTYDLFRYAINHGGLHLNGHGWLPLTFSEDLQEWAKE